MPAHASRTIGNRMQRFRNGLHSLESKSADFKHLSAEVKGFSKTLDAIEAADRAQEKAKLELKKATEALNGHLETADKTFASLKRSWQAKYGPTTIEGKSFDAPAQGKVAAPRARKKPATS